MKALLRFFFRRGKALTDDRLFRFYMVEFNAATPAWRSENVRL